MYQCPRAVSQAATDTGHRTSDQIRHQTSDIRHQRECRRYILATLRVLATPGVRAVLCCTPTMRFGNWRIRVRCDNPFRPPFLHPRRNSLPSGNWSPVRRARSMCPVLCAQSRDGRTGGAQHTYSRICAGPVGRANERMRPASELRAAGICGHLRA